MKRTISIRLEVTESQEKPLLQLRDMFLAACDAVVPAAMENRCWNRVALHNLVYSQIRKTSSLGSQMVCNAIFAVCKAYKAKTIIVNKRSMASGYAGLDNELFYMDKTMMVFGDAKKVIEDMVKAVE